jgi:type I restriction enzyme, S subunit
LAGSKFPLAPISSFEDVLQYGCSQRATDEPIGVPILRMSNLQAQGWDFTDLKYVQITDEELTRWRLERGDIVFNRTNSKELVGKCEVFDREGTWVFASYLMRLRVNREQAEPEFVAAFLNAPTGRLQIDRESRQIIGMSNINAEEIRTLRVPLPKPPKQRELLAALDAARAARRRKLEEAESLLGGLDAFVLEALGLTLPPFDGRTVYAVRLRDARQRFDPDYNSPRFRALRSKIERGKYPSESVGNLFHPIVSGFAAGGDDQTDDPSIGVPHIRPLNISNTAELHFDGTKMVPRSAVEPGDFLKQGEVLFNNTNSTAWVGKTVVFDADRECACSNHITRLTLIDKKHSPYYFAALFNALRGLGYFGLLSTNFNNQAGVNVDTLKAVRFPVPDDTTQKKIAAEVSRRREAARRLREEAAQLWDDAKRRFEEALLGSAATPQSHGSQSRAAQSRANRGGR